MRSRLGRACLQQVDGWVCGGGTWSRDFSVSIFEYRRLASCGPAAAGFQKKTARISGRSDASGVFFPLLLFWAAPRTYDPRKGGENAGVSRSGAWDVAGQPESIRWLRVCAMGNDHIRSDSKGVMHDPMIAIPFDQSAMRGADQFLPRDNSLRPRVGVGRRVSEAGICQYAFPPTFEPGCPQRHEQ